VYKRQANISGHSPEIVAFIGSAKKVFESWGYEVNILRAKTDFVTRFNGKLCRSPDPSRIGKLRGFPLAARKCWVKRDLKLKPLNEYRRSLSEEDVTEYVGIASDELERLDGLHTTSLLVKYGYTEEDAKALCESYGLLSPQYDLNNGRQKRDGCWFCPYAKLAEHKAIKKANPDAWYRYVEMENIPNLGYPKWNMYSNETLHHRDEIMSYGYEQLSIFDLKIS